MTTFEILLQARIIDNLQLQSALAHQRQWGGRIPAIIVEKRFTTDEVVVEALSKALRVPRMDMTRLTKDDAALARVDGAFCKEKAVFPIALQDGGKTLYVAMADPTDIPTIDALALKTRARIVPAIAAESQILRAVSAFYMGVDPFATAPTDSILEDGGIEGKFVDASGHTIVRDLKDLVAKADAVAAKEGAKAPPRPAPPVTTPAPMPAAAAGPMDAAGRLKKVQEQTEQSGQMIKALIELCIEKGVFRLDEYRAKLGK